MKSAVCEYFPCLVAKITGRDCSDYENCQSYKFYQRYGNEPLGIGACCDASRFSQLEKECQEIIENNEKGENRNE